MKRVVFTDEDPGCAAMAATLFDAMVHPDLVHGSWAAGELSLEASAQLRRTLQQAGVARPLPERLPSARPGADRVVLLTDAAPTLPAAEPSTVVERWRLSRAPLRSETDLVPPSTAHCEAGVGARWPRRSAAAKQGRRSRHHRGPHVPGLRPGAVRQASALTLRARRSAGRRGRADHRGAALPSLRGRIARH
jgi:hypothetical protein